MEDYIDTRVASSKQNHEVYIKVENEDCFDANDAPEEITHQVFIKSENEESITKEEILSDVLGHEDPLYSTSRKSAKEVDKRKLGENGRGPWTGSSWFKDGICGSINYTEYHISEMKFNAKEPEIKQETEEGDELQENEEEWSCSGVTSCDASEDLKRVEMLRKDEEEETNKYGEDIEMSKEGVVNKRKEELKEEVFVSCHHCGEKKKTKKQLKEHIYMVHLSVLIAQEKGVNERKTLKCTFCGKSFESKIHLIRHLNYHNLKKAYKCNYCDFRTTGSSNLRTHMNKHSGVRPFKCGVCQFSTGDKSSLRRHMFTHTGEKQFKCDLCGYRTSRQSNLKTHTLRIHTQEKPHKCNICGYRTADRSCLTRHIRIHTGVKPLKCDLCEYRAFRVSHLKLHAATHKKVLLLNTA